MRDTKALERKEHLTQRNLEIKQKNAKNKIRSKSCIEKTFSPTMKHGQPAASAVEEPMIDQKGKSIVLEIKQLKREINEELKREVKTDKNLMNSSSTTRKQPTALINATEAIVEAKSKKVAEERKGAANTSKCELEIDQDKI